MEAPHELAGPDVEGTDVSRDGRQPLRRSVPEDEEVFEDDAGRVGADEEIGSALAESGVQVDREELFARPGVHREERLSRSVENPTVPVGDSPIDANPDVDVSSLERIEAPLLFSGRGVEREQGEPRRRAVEHTVHDDRIALDLAPPVGVGPTGAVRPRDLELVDVATVDLVEHRVLGGALVTEIDRPVHVSDRRAASHDRQGRRSEDGEPIESSQGHAMVSRYRP